MTSVAVPKGFEIPKPEKLKKLISEKKYARIGYPTSVPKKLQSAITPSGWFSEPNNTVFVRSSQELEYYKNLGKKAPPVGRGLDLVFIDTLNIDGSEVSFRIAGKYSQIKHALRIALLNGQLGSVSKFGVTSLDEATVDAICNYYIFTYGYTYFSILNKKEHLQAYETIMEALGAFTQQNGYADFNRAVRSVNPFSSKTGLDLAYQSSGVLIANFISEVRAAKIISDSLKVSVKQQSELLQSLYMFNSFSKHTKSKWCVIIDENGAETSRESVAYGGTGVKSRFMKQLNKYANQPEKSFIDVSKYSRGNPVFSRVEIKEAKEAAKGKKSMKVNVPSFTWEGRPVPEGFVRTKDHDALKLWLKAIGVDKQVASSMAITVKALIDKRKEEVKSAAPAPAPIVFNPQGFTSVTAPSVVPSAGVGLPPSTSTLVPLPPGAAVTQTASLM